MVIFNEIKHLPVAILLAKNTNHRRLERLFYWRSEMQERGPIEILGAIIDEVEGLRRTDARSHLPDSLMREARAALEVHTVVGKPGGAQLSSIDGLVGRTVSHVFDSDLRRAQVVILCADGSFLALESQRDADESYISVDTLRTWGPPSRGLADYLNPADLVAAGLMTEAEATQIEKEAKKAEIDAAKARAETQINRLRAEVEQLEKQAA